jgi:hypothetical protein
VYAAYPAKKVICCVRVKPVGGQVLLSFKQTELFRGNPVMEHAFFRANGTITGYHLVNASTDSKLHTPTMATTMIVFH